MNEQPKEGFDFNRRDFLKQGSMAAIMAALGGVELVAQTNEAASSSQPAGPKVKAAVIGLGPWGREILNTLLLQPQAEVAAVCDNYAAFLKRGAKSAPGAAATLDYKEVLSNPEIKAVVVATGTHEHKQIVLDCLAAGKHVYCEAPLAHTIEDARAIAVAAKAASHLVFQSGLQLRSDVQRHFLLPFIRSGAIGQNVMARAQWHGKQSWRATSPNPEREKALNWRLDKAISLGLAGEKGIHPIDQAAWYFNARPTAVSGFGAVMFWKDGREVPDTVQAVIEFPGGLNMIYDATLANSFDSEYEILFGSDAAVMMRESKAWMFKEVDSALLGWEVYARKETFYKETGIVLLADASKSTPKEQPADAALTSTPLFFALRNFLRNTATVSAAAEDFTAIMGGDDKAALAEHIAGVARQPAAGPEEGYAATVVAIKANEAINGRKRVEIPPATYELA